MRFYKSLSFINKYSLKFLLIAFLGIHIPLLGIIGYVVTRPSDTYSPTEIILVALFLTLFGTLLTLYLLNELLKPVVISKKSLERYVNEGKLPQLPTEYKDEVGILMNQIQHTIELQDELLSEKEDILSLASHDLRSPAAQIKGLAYLLKDETDSAVIEEYCNIIDGQANKQIELLENLITLLKSGNTLKAAINYKKIKLSQLVSNCVKMNKSLFHAKNLKVSINNAYTDVEVLGEEMLLNQAIQNLLTNAIKFSNEGEEITVKVDYSNGYAKVLVADKGIGFDPSSSEKIFDRFTLKRKKGTRNESTTGLGLYLTKKIIESHGGKIEAFSEGENKGASFTILLPQQEDIKDISA